MAHKKKRRAVRIGLTVLLALAAPAGAVGTAAAAVPTAEAQLDWLVGATAHLPVPDADLEAHFTPAALTAAGGPDKLDQALEQLGPLQVQQVLLDQPTRSEAVVRAGSTDYLAETEVDATGLISNLGLGPYAPAPDSWSAADTELRSLAPQVAFTAAEIEPGGTCRVLHSVNQNAEEPLGSAFKLYVLGALGQAVADHRASWTQQLAIQDQYKSLPSGVLQNDPAGTKLTLQQFANYMISISDNTAADHLIHFLGRDAVQQQLQRFGNHDPAADTPFPTTRELFALKSVQYPTLADGYLALPRLLRAPALDALDRIPLRSLGAWTDPEKINQIEWFASATDLCRAYAGLAAENARPGGAPIGEALSINDGGIGLDRAQYPTVWFKGGSEPGVLTLNYLARTADGRTLVTSILLANPTAPINETTATPTALALARGAIQLANQATH